MHAHNTYVRCRRVLACMRVRCAYAKTMAQHYIQYIGLAIVCMCACVRYLTARQLVFVIIVIWHASVKLARGVFDCF